MLVALCIQKCEILAFCTCSILRNCIYKNCANVSSQTFTKLAYFHAAISAVLLMGTTDSLQLQLTTPVC